jgi:hypothetical protein
LLEEVADVLGLAHLLLAALLGFTQWITAAVNLLLLFGREILVLLNALLLSQALLTELALLALLTELAFLLATKHGPERTLENGRRVHFTLRFPSLLSHFSSWAHPALLTLTLKSRPNALFSHTSLLSFAHQTFLTFLLSLVH